MNRDGGPIADDPRPDNEPSSAGGDTSSTAGHEPTGFDWTYARDRILERVTIEIRFSKYRYSDTGILDELTQKACLRLHRASAQPIENLEGLLTTIARRTVMDYFKSETARTKRFADLDDEESGASFLQVASSPHEDDNPEEDYSRARTLVRMILQYWRREGRKECLELWKHWKKKVPFKEVADMLGGKPTTHRKRWERCLSGFRQLVQRDPRLLDELGFS